MMTESTQSSAVNYRLLRIASEQFGVPTSALDQQQQREAKSIALREYALEEAILASGDARGVMVPESQIEKAVEQIRCRFSDEAAFQNELSDIGLDLAGLEEALERELRVEAVLGLVGSRAPQVDETEATLYYYLNRDKFKRPESRTARHILVTVNDDFAENTRSAAMERLRQIRKRVAKNPSRFAEQAMQNSECPTALQGGLLGDVQPGMLYPELDRVLFKMAEGEISDVIESPIGLHILWCEQRQRGGVVPLVDVLPKLKQQLQEKQSNRFTRRWIQSLFAQETAEETVVG